MGSFTEIVVSFEFVDATPPEIVAAFSPWRVAGEGDEDAPQLPEHVSTVAPAVDEILDNLPDFEVITPFSPDTSRPVAALEDAVSTLTIEERATIWRITFEGTSPYYFPIGTSIQLKWRLRRWELAARFHLKESPEVSCALISSLGTYAESPPDGRYRRLAGYVKHEYDSSPILIWCQGEGPFKFEDLRPLRK